MWFESLLWVLVAAGPVSAAESDGAARGRVIDALPTRLSRNDGSDMRKASLASWEGNMVPGTDQRGRLVL
jgi:hypothetical protein